MNHVIIILVEPQNPGNVGMVCRAMKNMGLQELRLVNPCRLDHPDAAKFAVAARDLLEGAKIYPALREALEDCPFSVATTRRHGKYRQEILTPGEIAVKVLGASDTGRAALVFGREDSGLTTTEVALCRWQATIPTAGDYGSLNLAQAVLIFAYELFRAAGGSVPRRERVPAASGELETLYDHMEQTFLRIGFLNPQNPAHIMRTFRRILARAEVDQREVSVLRGLMAQIDWAAAGFKGKKKS
ncbi:MAG TPA: RNA methyltransferase [Geobacteraceae bacterium]|nr:RNA methyltransferase [Geobacteraceae bacterium]